MSAVTSENIGCLVETTLQTHMEFALIGDHQDPVNDAVPGIVAGNDEAIESVERNGSPTFLIVTTTGGQRFRIFITEIE